MDGLGIVPYMFGMLGQCFPLEVLLGGWRQAQAHPDGLKKPGLVTCQGLSCRASVCVADVEEDVWTGPAWAVRDLCRSCGRRVFGRCRWRQP